MSFGHTVVEEVTDANEVARFRRDRERHALNDAVLREHLPRIYRECRGKVVVVAGQQLHFADTPEEAWVWARTRHPEDTAPIVRYIPAERASRVYAASRRVVPL